MSRIRSIKPDFFRHEGLQELEAAHPGSYPMMVFAGLWTQCDRNGVFPFRPRQLKLDILPFLPFEMEKTLNILIKSGFLSCFEVDGKVFGYVQTFKCHQRISGKEAQSSPTYPTPEMGSTWEASEKHPGAQEVEVEVEVEVEKEKEVEGRKTYTRHRQSEEFENFWHQYPRRNGIRVGKQNAAKQYAKHVTSDEDARLVLVALKNYSARCGDYVADAERWLRKWRDYLDAEPVKPKSNGGGWIETLRDTGALDNDAEGCGPDYRTGVLALPLTPS